VNRDWYIHPPGSAAEEGPLSEEELLDLLTAGDITPETPCRHAASGRTAAAGALFRTISPVIAERAAPVPWQPAPFPQEKAESPAAPRTRLIYHGHTCVLCYWRSGLLVAALAAGGVLVRETRPVLFLCGLLAAAVVLLAAVLRRMSGHYILTSSRVEARRGLLAPRSRELRIADIRAVNITGSGWPGVGSVTFTGPASPADDVLFRNVWRPGRMKAVVRRLQAR
jgi:hypothetical protein